MFGFSLDFVPCDFFFRLSSLARHWFYGGVRKLGILSCCMLEVFRLKIWLVCSGILKVILFPALFGS